MLPAGSTATLGRLQADHWDDQLILEPRSSQGAWDGQGPAYVLANVQLSPFDLLKYSSESNKVYGHSSWCGKA